MTQSGSFGQEQLQRALADPGVETATPFYVTTSTWRNPDDGLRYPLLVMGVRPTAPAFLKPEVADQTPLLTQGNAVLFDQNSLPMFGPRYVGLSTVAGDEHVSVVGVYHNGAGFAGAGAMIVSDATFFAMTSPGRKAGEVNLGLVRVKPGEDPAAVADRLRQSTPPNIRVWERAEVEAYEKDFWTSKKPIGIMFSSGVVIGVLIGGVIFYQVLATDILKHLREYATMKAMGYTDWAVSSVVLQQAALFQVFSFVPALVIATGLYTAMREGAAINITMTASRALLVFLLTLGMCAACAWLGVRKVRTADPVELF